MPVAFIAWRCPSCIIGFAGVSWMETRVSAATLNVVDPVTPSRKARSSVEPNALPVTVPLDPEALLTEAMAASATDQVTVSVMSIAEPSVVDAARLERSTRADRNHRGGRRHSDCSRASPTSP